METHVQNTQQQDSLTGVKKSQLRDSGKKSKQSVVIVEIQINGLEDQIIRNISKHKGKM